MHIVHITHACMHCTALPQWPALQMQQGPGAASVGAYEGELLDAISRAGANPSTVAGQYQARAHVKLQGAAPLAKPALGTLLSDLQHPFTGLSTGPLRR